MVANKSKTRSTRGAKPARSVALTVATGPGALAVRDEHDEEADATLAELSTLAGHKLLDLAVASGDLLIRRCYGGSLALARERGPLKVVVLDRIFERAAAFKLSPALLRRSIPLTVQYRDLPARTRQALTLPQHEALLPVRDLAEKKRLAEEALRSGLSRTQIEALVRGKVEGRAGASSRTTEGRPTKPYVVKAARIACRALVAAQVEADLATARIAGMSEAHIADLHRDLHTLRERIERIEDALRKHRR